MPCWTGASSHKFPTYWPGGATIFASSSYRMTANRAPAALAMTTCEGGGGGLPLPVFDGLYNVYKPRSTTSAVYTIASSCAVQNDNLLNLPEMS